MRKLYVLFSLILIGQITWAQAALNLDGADDHISSNYSGITGSGERTVEAWIRTTANSIPGQGGQKVLVNWGSMTTGTRFTFCLLWNNAIRLEIGGSGLSGNTAVNDGIWHHVAATYKSGLVSLYVDGVLDTSGTLSGVNTSSGGFVIGRRVDGVNYFDGDIDEIRVWNTALNPAQLALKDSSEYCIAPNNLVAYYKCNDGTPLANNSAISAIIDHSANGKNGSLQNFALAGSSSNFVASPVQGAGLNLALSINSCGPYTAPNGITYNSSGHYQDTINSPSGCDTIIDLNLNVTNLNPAARRISANQLEALESDTNAHFQWLNCNTNHSKISGATSKVFTFVQNGNYAVEVGLNGCIDTSACILVSNVGLQSFEDSEIQVYPNPATSKLQISVKAGDYNRYYLLDLQGRLILGGDLDLNGQSKISLPKVPDGIYLLRLEGKEQRTQKKLQVVH